jgi:hypothetical protein
MNKQEQRIVRLSRDEDGTEVWLDTQTSQELVGAVQREDAIVPHPFIGMALDYFAEQEWHYHLTRPTYVWWRLYGKHATYILAFYTDEVPILGCRVTIPIRVPDEDRARALDFLNRANYGRRNGAFELDPDEGEVRFRLSFDAAFAPLAPEMIGRLVGGAMWACEKYFPGLMKVIYAGQDPGEAIEEIERP